MEVIGGYFELADSEEGVFPHNNGILLNTGRNALEYILRCIEDIKGVYLPYYTCEAILEPLKKLNIPWFFYHINSQFEMADDIHPQKGEYLIANNYYGIKDSYILGLALKYGDHLIVDCSQALFAKPIPGIKSFYSTRKFVGVADGGIAYLGHHEAKKVPIFEVDCTSDHDSHLFKRKELGAEAGFADYRTNELKLSNQPIRWMSNTTKQILDNINYDNVIYRRNENFRFLHNSLVYDNSLRLPDLNSFACPMVYPFVNNHKHLRQLLIDNKIFVAKYWPNVHKLNQYETEYDLTTRVIPIPCDQRYSIKDMERILSIININLS